MSKLTMVMDTLLVMPMLDCTCVGDQVQAGDHIANVGCTGRCTGPHLHYEVVKDGQRKNPSTYLAMLP